LDTQAYGGDNLDIIHGFFPEPNVTQLTYKSFTLTHLSQAVDSRFTTCFKSNSGAQLCLDAILEVHKVGTLQESLETQVQERKH
jgi:hypothetical protein